MTADVSSHSLCVSVSPTSPVEAAVGTSLTIQVDVSCSEGCDLQGTTVAAVSPEGPLATRHLGAADDGQHTTELTLRCPEQVGEYSWDIRVSRIESETAIHEESTLPLTLRTLAHRTSLAVWEVTSPVAVNRMVRLKVGAKCAEACELTGQTVEFCDEHGAEIGETRLGNTPLESTAALYWGRGELAAPPFEKLYVWSARLKPSELRLAHDEATTTFSFATDKPADHRATIELVAKDTQTPIAGAEVRLGLYASTSDASGTAVFDLPKGSYDLGVRVDGYEAPTTKIDVDDDVRIRVEAIKTLTQAEREDRLERYVDIPWG